MKLTRRTTTKRWLVAGAALILAGAMAFAQGPRGPRGNGPGDGPGMGPGMGAGGGMMHQMIGAALGLTDAQKTQAQEIRDATLAANEPYVAQLKTLRDAEIEAIKAGKSEVELRNLAQGMGVLTANIHANRLIGEAKFWNILTPEQQAKLDQFRANMREHLQDRLGARLGSPQN